MQIGDAPTPFPHAVAGSGQPRPPHAAVGASNRAATESSGRFEAPHRHTYHGSGEKQRPQQTSLEREIAARTLVQGMHDDRRGTFRGFSGDEACQQEDMAELPSFLQGRRRSIARNNISLAGLSLQSNRRATLDGIFKKRHGTEDWRDGDRDPRRHTIDSVCSASRASTSSEWSYCLFSATSDTNPHSTSGMLTLDNYDEHTYEVEACIEDRFQHSAEAFYEDEDSGWYGLTFGSGLKELDAQNIVDRAASFHQQFYCCSRRSTMDGAVDFHR